MGPDTGRYNLKPAERVFAPGAGCAPMQPSVAYPAAGTPRASAPGTPRGPRCLIPKREEIDCHDPTP